MPLVPQQPCLALRENRGLHLKKLKRLWNLMRTPDGPHLGIRNWSPDAFTRSSRMWRGFTETANNWHMFHSHTFALLHVSINDGDSIRGRRRHLRQQHCDEIVHIGATHRRFWRRLCFPLSQLTVDSSSDGILVLKKRPLSCSSCSCP